MANHKSAAKRARQALKRRARNRIAKSEMRTAIKKLRKLVEDNSLEEAKNFLPHTVSVIQKKAEKGILHKNTAARYVSRLTKLVNKASVAENN